jgi:hypothetical protein
MRRINLLAMLLAAMLVAVPAMAQSKAIDQNYEAEKAAEISNAKLQLATQPGSAAVQELNEAEDTLRRLKSTNGAEMRRKIAAELEMAITRLKVAADAGARRPLR